MEEDGEIRREDEESNSTLGENKEEERNAKTREHGEKSFDELLSVEYGKRRTWKDTRTQSISSLELITR